MINDTEDQAALEALENRLKTILPELYQDSYEELQPTSMGSAELKFDAEGRVAWNDIWGSFCDLAMAGGPPHKGRLLEPGSPTEIEANPERYQQVLEEVHRGIAMVTGLAIEPPSTPGWIRVHCARSGMAAWLVRAITMENVSSYSKGPLLYLPVGPTYKIEKEIKNVVTVIAKTHHYWSSHMSPRQQHHIANLFARMEVEFPLLHPAPSEATTTSALYQSIGGSIYQTTGLCTVRQQYNGWLGLACPDVHAAIWIMRALVASNILSRREETTLFLPIDPERDPYGERIATVLNRIHRFAVSRACFGHLPSV